MTEPEPEDALIGQVVDERYRVERRIGEGGMGRVYEVTHVTFHRRMVLKTLIPQLSDDAGLFQRFLREARAAASAGGPHVVGVSDFGSLPDGRSFYVMEHVDGVSLDEALEALDGVPMPVERALEITRGIVRAVGAAHDAGIIHRDLKPDNVMLSARHGRTDFVQVCDFGLAYVHTEDQRLTLQGELIGTPYYMAPEQCVAEPADHRADLYAVGVILYELLTYELPHDSDNLSSLLRMKVGLEPTAPSQSAGCEHIPADVDAFVLKLLEAKPADRFQSHDEVMVAIEALIGPEPTASASITGGFAAANVAPVLRADSVQGTFDPPASVPAPSVPEPRPAPATKTWLPMALGIVLLAVGVGGGLGAWWILSRGASPPEPAAAPPTAAPPSAEVAPAPTAERPPPPPAVAPRVQPTPPEPALEVADEPTADEEPADEAERPWWDRRRR